MRSSWRLAIAAMLLLWVTVEGCSSETTAPEVGNIIIDADPDSLQAPWQLAGPGAFSGSGTGDSTLTALPPGDYVVTWGAVVAPWQMPNPIIVTKTLHAHATVTFAAAYTLPAPRISIDAQPNGILAPWRITGPNGFSQAGAGDIEIEDAAVGEYTLVWEAVAGWNSPSPETSAQVLNLGGRLIFAGRYRSDLMPIPSGSFTMGSPEDEDGRNVDEAPHAVVLTHDFGCLSAEVTNLQFATAAQWAYDHGLVTVANASLIDNLDGSTRRLLDPYPGDGSIYLIDGTFRISNGKEDHPVLGVSWHGAAAYCDWLSLMSGLPRAYDHSTWQCNGGSPATAAGFRLPTEAEWEYACRAATSSAFHTGACLDADTQANYDGYYPYLGCPAGPRVGRAAPVAGYAKSGFGLYDMHGNVWEWCNDWYGTYGDSATDPDGPESGSVRVLRGGTWRWSASVCRSAERGSADPGYSSDDIGFRVVRTLGAGPRGSDNGGRSLRPPHLAASRSGVSR